MISPELLKKVRQIQIRTSRLVTDVLAGEYISAFKGRGMEFDEVREYYPGDEIRSIDWNVTARTGVPHVKNYREERELTVMFLVDVSSSGNYGTGYQTKLELATEICAVLAFSAIKSNDKVGLITFSDKEHISYLPPRKGKKHVLRVIRDLLNHRQGNWQTDIPAAIDLLNKLTKRKAVVFLVSDFFIEDKDLVDFEKSLTLASKRHDLVNIVVSDPTEINLPNVGLIEFEDSETGEILLVDTGSSDVRQKYSFETQSQREWRKNKFFSTGVDFMEVVTDQSYIDEIVRFFKKRDSKK